MATVRIYKVAELLATSSQEVVALLKRDHGIDVKSASSTIEEVVGRQFVERLARQRRIALPSGDIFAEVPVSKGKKAGPARKVEPPKPALPPPRLVKTIRPRPVEPSAAEAAAEVSVEPAPGEVVEQVAPVEEVAQAPAAEAPRQEPAAIVETLPVVTVEPQEPEARVVAAPSEPEAVEPQAEPAVITPAAAPVEPPAPVGPAAP